MRCCILAKFVTTSSSMSRRTARDCRHSMGLDTMELETEQDKDKKRAEKNWDRAANAYELLINYVKLQKQARKRISLKVEDLLYASNFKGGQGAITEPTKSLQAKLKVYSEQLRDIDDILKSASLRSLSKSKLPKLKKACDTYLRLCLNKDSKIRGFGPAYAAALASAYFPTALPVIDYRVLNGAHINETELKTTNKQIPQAKLVSYYSELLIYCHKRLKNNKKLTLRKLDKQLFCRTLG